MQRVLDGMESIPEDMAHRIAADLLDGYLNCCYRSAKNDRDGNRLASLLDAAESLPYLLGFVFACERRVRPYNKFLAWELSGTHCNPSTGRVGCCCPHSKASCDATGTWPSKGNYARTVRTARTHGFDAVVDDWGDEALRVLDALARA